LRIQASASFLVVVPIDDVVAAILNARAAPIGGGNFFCLLLAEVTMARVIFGAWDGNVIDNRNRKVFDIEEHQAFHAFDEFNPGNPVKAFFEDHGFFIFQKDVNLLNQLLLATSFM
jgi:hypothetical protein